MGYSACCDGILLVLKQTPSPVASRLSSPPPREQRRLGLPVYPGTTTTADPGAGGPQGSASRPLCSPRESVPPQSWGRPPAAAVLQAEVPQQLCKPSSRPFPPAPPTPQSPRPAVKEAPRNPHLLRLGMSPFPALQPACSSAGRPGDTNPSGDLQRLGHGSAGRVRDATGAWPQEPHGRPSAGTDVQSAPKSGQAHIPVSPAGVGAVPRCTACRTFR